MRACPVEKLLAMKRRGDKFFLFLSSRSILRAKREQVK